MPTLLDVPSDSTMPPPSQTVVMVDVEAAVADEVAVVALSVEDVEVVVVVDVVVSVIVEDVVVAVEHLPTEVASATSRARSRLSKSL